MLQLEPDARLGAPACGGYAALKAHPFFTDDVEAPIDFASVHLSPPPPLVPPPPMPAATATLVISQQRMDATITRPVSRPPSSAETGVTP